MSDEQRAAVVIQKAVRGWMCRKRLSRRGKCLEFRLKNFWPKRKPPVYRKKARMSMRSLVEKKVVMIQKHVRGFLQRKRYKELLIDKMLEEQEDHFRSQIETIEKELNIHSGTPKNSKTATVLKPKDSNRYLELPLPMSQRRSPSKYKRNRPALFEYDYYILAAIEIQRIFRGYLIRKTYGNFKTLRKQVIKFQRTYRQWRQKKHGQLELAATLMTKQCSMLATSYSSYQHLKSLILTQDKQNKYIKFITHCENRLGEAGVTNSQCVNKYLEQSYKSKYKGIIAEYLKGLKALKFGMEIAQKSNYEHISKLVRNLAEVSRDMDSESFCENSTFLPDVSFIDKSSINII
jgi:hypothetical protein